VGPKWKIQSKGARTPFSYSSTPGGGGRKAIVEEDLLKVGCRGYQTIEAKEVAISSILVGVIGRNFPWESLKGC